MVGTEFPDVAGTVVFEEDSLVLRRSWGRRLRSQMVRWRRGRPSGRLFAVLSLLWTGLIPVLIALDLSLFFDLWEGGGSSRKLIPDGGVALVGVAVMLNRAVRPRRIPLSRLEGDVSTSGPRTLHLPADAFGPLHSFARLWTRPTITFLRSDDRDRLVSHLEQHGVDVDSD